MTCSSFKPWTPRVDSGEDKTEVSVTGFQNTAFFDRNYLEARVMLEEDKTKLLSQTCTLRYQMITPACLIILRFFIHQCNLFQSRSIIGLDIFYHPACLIHAACLIHPLLLHSNGRSCLLTY